MLIKFASC